MTDRMDEILDELLEQSSTNATGDYVEFDVRDVEEAAFKRGRKEGMFNFLSDDSSGISPADWALLVIKAKRQQATRKHESVGGRRRRKFHYISSTGLWKATGGMTVSQLYTVAQDYERQGRALEAKRDGVYELIDELKDLARRLGIVEDTIAVVELDKRSVPQAAVAS